MTHSSNPLKNANVDARVDPRLALVVQAVVAIPGLAPMTLGVCELSRSGMFLAFKDTGSSHADYEHNGVEAGTRCEIAFTARVAEAPQRVRVSAEIVRVTRHGIGVRFSTRNPPQLSALRDLFLRAEREATKGDTGSDSAGRRAADEARPSAPPAAGAWPEWELIDD